MIMSHLVVDKIKTANAASARQLFTARPHGKTRLVLLFLKPRFHCGKILKSTRFELRHIAVRDPVLYRQLKPSYHKALTVERTKVIRKSHGHFVRELPRRFVLLRVKGKCTGKYDKSEKN
jgi:hypothetical protein